MMSLKLLPLCGDVRNVFNVFVKNLFSEDNLRHPWTPLTLRIPITPIEVHLPTKRSPSQS